MTDLIHFSASAPNTSFVRVSGEGDARIQFDVPASDLPAVLELIAYGPGALLRVTVEIAPS